MQGPHRTHAWSPENRADRGCYPRGAQKTNEIPRPGDRLVPASGDEATPWRGHSEERGVPLEPRGRPQESPLGAGVSRSSVGRGMEGPGAGEGAVGSQCLMGTEFQHGKMKVWRWMVVM